VFQLRYNAVARIWFEGQATIPPGVDPDTHENVQVLRPWVALNDNERALYGRVIFRIILPLDVDPYDSQNDPNGLGTTLNIDGSGTQDFFYVVSRVPLVSAGEQIAWQCWCANPRYL